ncbi:hypothetical protein [Streptomyces sp. NPDC059786]|uniref:hypothetical protein n=1 Tax=Streptomyces sp. NPDC059786 TaxID=3346946 RepID=UPI0036689ED5
MESHRGRRRRARRPGRRPFVWTALAGAVLVGGTAAGTAYVKTQAHADSGAVSSSASSAAGEEASVEPVAEPSVDRDAVLAEAMESVTLEDGAATSVAVLDLASGESATSGDDAFDTASIVKVDILAALLLQAQDADRELTAQEKTYATAMIEDSDNDSATALWDAIGGTTGLDAANKRFGLTATAGGAGPLWGLTQTTAADQLVLLQQVFGDDSELSTDSQTYLQGLMGAIADDQHWGVSAAATGSGDGEGSAWALKNGWLARSTTGLWDINSIGRITVDGDDYLVVALSNGNTTKAKGISLVETVAKTAVTAFRDAES